MEWIKKSPRLQVMEHEGRRFRIEKTGNSHCGSGCVKVREVDESHRDLQRETANGMAAARKIVAGWLEKPRPDFPLPADRTQIRDLTLGQGRRFGY